MTWPVATASKAIDEVLAVASRLGAFTHGGIGSELLPKEGSAEDRYQWEKNLGSVLTFLEKKKLIVGETKPEFTPNMGFLMEIRHGRVTKLGRALANAPRVVRLGILWVIVAWRRLLSILGALAFIKILHNAYLGLVLAIGWIEYLCAAILFAVLYFTIRRALGKD